MAMPPRVLLAVLAITSFAHLLPHAAAESGGTTRISAVSHHARTGDKRYPYRAKSQYVLEELDLKWGDVIVDVGAGDGWWAERMAQYIGETGVIHAAEVDEEKVVIERCCLSSAWVVREATRPSTDMRNRRDLPCGSRCVLAVPAKLPHELAIPRSPRWQ